MLEGFLFTVMPTVLLTCHLILFPWQPHQSGIYDFFKGNELQRSLRETHTDCPCCVLFSSQTSFFSWTLVLKKSMLNKKTLYFFCMCIYMCVAEYSWRSEVKEVSSPLPFLLLSIFCFESGSLPGVGARWFSLTDYLASLKDALAFYPQHSDCRCTQHTQLFMWVPGIWTLVCTLPTEPSPQPPTPVVFWLAPILLHAHLPRNSFLCWSQRLPESRYVPKKCKGTL